MLNRVVGPCAFWALLAAGCDEAAIRPSDMGAQLDGVTIEAAADADADADAGSDGGPIDLGPDTSADAGPDAADAGPVVRPPTSPADVVLPAIPWATGRTRDALDAADPVTAATELPSLLACPTGWEEQRIAAEDPALCEPWPASESPRCATGEAAFVDDVDGCGPVGDACPVGPWPGSIPADAVYVTPGSSGDGSRASPVGTIAEALTLVADIAGPVTIVLGAGTFAESIIVGRADVTIRGSCASRTIIAPTGVASPVVRAASTGLQLRALSIAGGSEGLVVDAGVVVDLQGVIVGSSPVPIRVAGTLTGDSVVASDATGAAAIEVTEGGNVALGRVVIARSAGRGASCERPGHLTLRDVAVESTEREGLVVGGGCTATLERAVIEGATGSGVAVRGAGSTATATQTLVRDTRASLGGSGGYGFESSAGATLNASRFAIVAARDNGVHVNAGVVVLTDGVIVDTAATSSGGFGMGLLVLEGGTADATRLYLARNLDQAVGVWNDPSRLTARHLTVRDTRCNPMGYCGGSLNALGASQVTIEHANLDGSPSYGLQVGGGATLVASDTYLAASPGVSAVGLRAQQFGVAMLSASRIERWTGAAITTEGATGSGGGMVVLADVAIASGAADVADLALGLVAREGGTIDGQNVVIAGCAGSSVEASGAGSTVDLTGAVIGDTRASRDPSRSALQASSGGTVAVHGGELLRSGDTAASASDGAMLVLSDVRTTGSVGPGLQLLRGAIATVERVEIGGHEVAGALVEGGVLMAMDLRVAAPTSGAGGAYGIVAMEEATVVVDRLAVSAARGLGVGAWGRATTITLRDALIERTSSAAGVAVSIGFYDDPLLELSGFSCTDGAGIGLQLAPTPSRAIGAGVVSGHAIGVAASSTTGLDDLLAEVVLLDDDTPVEAPSVRPTPVPPTPVE